MKPDIDAAQFELVLRKGATRRPRQRAAVPGVEKSFMTGADELLALRVEMHGAHKMSAALAECF